MLRHAGRYRALFSISFALVLASLWVLDGIRGVAVGTLIVRAAGMLIAVRLEIHEIL